MVPCAGALWVLLKEREKGVLLREGWAGRAGSPGPLEDSLLNNPVLLADRQRAADSGSQGAAPEGQVPAGPAKPTHPAAGLPGKGDPAAQQGGPLGPGPWGDRAS